VLEHFPRAKAHLCERVDSPGPVLAASHLPLRLLQLRRAQKSVDHQIPHEYDGVREVGVGQFEDSLQILSGEFLWGHFSEGPNGCHIFFPAEVDACFLHDVGELLLADVAADVFESILNFHRYYRRKFKW